MSRIVGQVRKYMADGYPMKYRHYAPAGDPRAYLVGLHGIQSHSGWYEWSSSRLAEAGFDVRFLDRSCAGLNPRARRGLHDYDHLKLVADVQIFIDLLLRDGVSQDRIILLSVSWGAKLAAALLVDWPSHIRTRQMMQFTGLEGVSDLPDIQPSAFAGAAFLYPAIFTHFDPTWAQRCGIRFADTFGLGRKQIPIPLDDPALFTDDPHWQQFIDDDPLTLREVPLRFLNSTLQLTAQARRYPRSDPPRTLIALAGRDEIVDLPRTREWATQLPAEKMRMVEYPDARHTLEFDACREQFVADLIDWIESTITAHA